MRAHLLQYDIVWEDKPANHAIVRRLSERARVEAGDLVVLPEMFDTGFSMRTERTAADPERSLEFLSDLAADLRAHIVASIPIRLPDPPSDGRDCVNRAYIVGPGGVVEGESDKVHPFSFGRESERFIGGDSVEVAPVGVSAEPVGLCPIVCYDLRFPECFRAGVDRGAEVFAVIANWPSARADHWRALCVARAIENQAFVLGLNRCGRDPKLAYAGGSIVVDATGGVVLEAGDQEAVMSAELDIDGLRAWRARFPALRDRKAWSIGDGRSGSADG